MLMLRHSSKRSCPGYHGRPWPITQAVANHRIAMLHPTHGAPGSPPHTTVSPVSLPPPPPRNRIGHLEGHLAGRRQVTWWWVSPISLVSPICPPAP